MALPDHPGPDAHAAAVAGHEKAMSGVGQHRHQTGQFGSVVPTALAGGIQDASEPLDFIDGTASTNVYGQAMKP